MFELILLLSFNFLYFYLNFKFYGVFFILFKILIFLARKKISLS